MDSVFKFTKSHDLKLVIIALLYVLAGYVGLLFAFPESKAIPFWPAAGLGLAMMLIYGTRIWPAIAIGSIISAALLFNHNDIPLSIESITALVFFMIVGVCEALLGYILIKKLIGRTNPFFNTTHSFIFIFVVLFISLCGGAVITLVYVAGGLVPVNNYLELVALYFCAQSVGTFVITPFLLSFKKSFDINLNKYVLIEVAAFTLALTGVIFSLRIDGLSATFVKSFPFMVMPFLLWVAFRSNALITTVFVVGLSFTAVYFTVNGVGPFVLEAESSSMMMLQIYMGITAIIGFILNTTVWERTQAEKSIRSFNEKLEENVQERTKELNEEIAMRKSTEEKMKISNRQLRKTNTELDNFVYSVSHDLRAPIASVLGLINLAEKEDDIKMMKKYMEHIGKSAKQQDAFIKDILDLSRNARLEIAQDNILFQDIISETFEQFQYYNINKNVIKEIEIKQDSKFLSDKKRLKVILNNLISNSIRYCNGDSPIIRIKVDVNETTAKIMIEDNGIGIDEKHLKDVFKMFYRANEDNAGSGLGLYIVKETIDKLRGNVTLQSEDKKGTRVNIELPNLIYN